mmetsp:Transcript_12994/g.47481  ORF Transcript_12994/g.47481 Transcript_12994/m.47481 type:complete len:720 (-) Transcript_12994:1206-3365(-)
MTQGLTRPSWGWKIVASHWVTRLGTQAWALAMPLALLAVSYKEVVDQGVVVATETSVRGAALYMFARYGAKTLLAPGLGGWADSTSDRLLVVRLGVLAQFVSIGSMTTAAAACYLMVAGNAPLSEMSTWQLANISFSDWFVILACVTGVFEVLGSTTVGVAVSKQWLPTLAMSEALPEVDGISRTSKEEREMRSELMASLNADMSRADLFSEVVAPIAAGVAISVAGHGNELGVLACVGLCNLFSYIPEYVLLSQVYDATESLSKGSAHEIIAQPERSSQTLGQMLIGFLEPTRTAWVSFLEHPYGLQAVVASYSLLYLTVLSPHGVLLTAYLASAQVPADALGIFRASGAIAGVLGVSAYSSSLLRSRVSNEGDWSPPSSMYASWMLVSTLGAAISFHAAMDTIQMAGLISFMFFVVIARFGLYGMELGCLELQQKHCDERSRASIGSVEGSLCALFTLLVYTAGLFLPSTTVSDDMPVTSNGFGFEFLVDASVFFVSVACITHILWALFWREEEHPHELVSLSVAAEHSADSLESREISAAAGSAVPVKSRHPHVSQHVPPFVSAPGQFLSEAASKAAQAAGSAEGASASSMWYTFYSRLAREDCERDECEASKAASLEDAGGPPNPAVTVLRQRVEHSHLVYKGPRGLASQFLGAERGARAKQWRLRGLSQPTDSVPRNNRRGSSSVLQTMTRRRHRSVYTSASVSLLRPSWGVRL